MDLPVDFMLADPLSVAVGISKKRANAMPRVSSNARLNEDAGSYLQLFAGFLVKAAVLGVVVYLLTNFNLHRQVVQFLYGMPRITPSRSLLLLLL